MSHPKILFKLTGSIACFKAAGLISQLVQSGFEVQSVATPSALRFIGEATLEGLTGRKVLTDTFASGDLMGHLNWAKWADLTIVCPATANTINKLANGFGDDLLTTLFLAHDFKKPYLLAPAMNTKMLEHPATQQSLTKLRSYGVEILEPSAGTLACGDVGTGRLIEVEEALKEIRKHLSVNSIIEKFDSEDSLFRAQRILVTSGGTREPVDGVRSLTNLSTGETGAVIAEHLAEVGHSVTLLSAKGSRLPRCPVNLKSYVTFKDLECALKEELTNHYDAVIHLAAVSDYSVGAVEVDGSLKEPSSDLKLSSSSEIKLHLKWNPKLIDQLRNFSVNKEIKVIAFKLTKNADTELISEKVDALLKTSHPNFVVHNDVSEISGQLHKAKILDQSGHPVAEVSSKKELAENLEQLIREARS